jgi:uncharacterized RDD family membrane protein YckC
MTQPIVWPSEPPTDFVLPPPPPEEHRRPVASMWTRVGELVLEFVLMACTFGFGWVGWWIIAWADGQSPAKVVLHLHVVRADTAQLASFARMAVREALGKGLAGAAALAGAYFGVAWLVALAAIYLVAGASVGLLDVRRRTLWDRLTGTVVLDGDPPAPSASTDPAGEGTSPG